jgi:acetyl-CoA synthetase
MARKPVPSDNWAALHGNFRWRVPPAFNIADACCGRWARNPSTAMRVAIHWEREDGRAGALSYGALQQQANRLSHALLRAGVQAGDRVAIVLPQRPEVAVAHIAIYQIGAVAVPLSQLFGPEALEYRLRDSAAVLAIADVGALATLRQVRPACPALHTVLAIEGALSARGELDWADALGREPSSFVGQITTADAPAVLIYTSGTTGPPKGALIPHRALLGNLPGFVCSQNWFAGQAGGVFWSPADWAWTGGLMDALLPALFFGREIVAFNGRFTPERAFELLQRHRVTHSFLFPTALKAMMKAVPEPKARYRLQLLGLMSAGEAVGDALFAWCREGMGVPVNEMFGQTEVNYVVGNCASYLDATGTRHPGWPARAGSMGRAYPGHRVAVIDDAGRELLPGEPGEVAVNRLDVHGHPDPVFFLGYWNNEAATRKRFTGDPAASWWRTGDMARQDAQGYLWYEGRSDDMFKAAGYRIGPGEVENCLVKHPSVANAAVVPKPDAERGAVVKAYVVLAPGHIGSAGLVQMLQAHVKGKLAPYEYPKEIEFVDALPMTTTGKVQRRVLREREEELAAKAARKKPGR